jgi:hypothetical protein
VLLSRRFLSYNIGNHTGRQNETTFVGSIIMLSPVYTEILVDQCNMSIILFTDQATNPNNTELDVSAVDGLCDILLNEPALIGEATEKLAFKIQSTNKNESLFALDALQVNEKKKIFSR